MKYNRSYIDRFQKKIEETELDAFLVSNPINIKYLTGFSTSDGFLIITKGEVFFFTSFCELGEAEAQISAAKIKERKRGDWDFLKSFLKRKKIKKIGFEERYFSLANFKLIKGFFLDCQFRKTSDLIERFRAVKSSEELKRIEGAIIVTEKIFAGVKKNLKPGLTELDILKYLSIYIAREGIRPAFTPIVAFGSHSAFPHALAGKRRLKKGDIVLIDMGVDINGYKSDLTRTFIFGRLKPKQEKVYNLVREAQDYLFRLIKPGISVKDVENCAHRFFAKKGWGKFFPHSIGHGIGLEVHESPFFSRKSKEKLLPGMIFTLEPALYLPGWGGVRIEDMFLVTQKKCKNLSDFSKDPSIN